MSKDAEPVAEGRGRTIKVRVSDAEHARLRALCPQHHLAAWMRETALGTAPARRVPPVAPELLRQLAGAGNLFNQIARALHRGNWTPADRVQVLARLVAAEQHLAAIRTAHDADAPPSEISDGGVGEFRPSRELRP